MSPYSCKRLPDGRWFIWTKKAGTDGMGANGTMFLGPALYPQGATMSEKETTVGRISFPAPQDWRPVSTAVKEWPKAPPQSVVIACPCGGRPVVGWGGWMDCECGRTYRLRYSVEVKG